ncbi:indolepyruvate ferredoxin oxidoreductase family protein [Streptomyces sp. NPDC005355]|uniref:indolepyruvate ferredoxin oxidoreductase family protein n=1 Tax=Streptomyces sp. NPDC005355 TaxID=3157038 RepID=UPI0033A0225E
MAADLGGLDHAYLPAEVLRRSSGRVALTGVQALAKLLVEQQRADTLRGWRTAGLVSGYRGSPLGGFDQVLERHGELLTEHRITFIPGVNEELGATVVQGSQLASTLPEAKHDGVFGLWYGKAPGVDRSADAFKHGNWMGATARGGVLVAAGDDPACKSSSLPSNSVMALAESYMPVLAPADVSDVLRMGRLGFELSRFSGAWVGFTIVTNVADAYETVSLDSRIDIVTPEFAWENRPWRPAVRPGMTISEAIALESEVLDGRLAAAVRFAAANGIDRVHGATGAARIGLVTSGHTYQQLRQALDRLGLDEAALGQHGIRLLCLGLVHPVDREKLRQFATGLDELLVIEEKRSFIETQVKDALYDLADHPRVFGKRGSAGEVLVPVHSALDADRISTFLTPWLAARVGTEHLDLRRPRSAHGPVDLTLTPVKRTAYFCSGCPHNRSTEVPDGSLAGSGIGCHIMTTFMDRSMGFTQMGGEGANWVGAAPFTDTQHIFQNLGDGTFFHSGSLAVRQAVAAGTHITFKLLYNGAVAMTGGQPADGSVDPVSLSWLLFGEGVGRIAVVTDGPGRYPRKAKWAPEVTVHHRDDLDAVQRELRDVDGVTVLLYDQACAAEERRKRKRGLSPEPAERVLINEAVCEGCGDCGKKSNCLSVEPVDTEFGRKTRINQSSCNKDFSCLLGDCPSFLTVIPGRHAGRDLDRAGELGELAEPSTRPAAADVVMVGIGGTGVVTTNQILATAALISGMDARALDQTGMSQKAGAVVSHLRLAREPRERSGYISAGTADVYLAFDALAASDAANLARCDPRRTAAVVSTSEVPTGRMVVDPGTLYPRPGALLDRISRHSRAGSLFTLDALRLSDALFGDSAAANFIVVGAAYQRGLLPLRAEAIERAIELNGAGVSTTIQAFRAGRKAVLDPRWSRECPAGAVPDDLPRARHAARSAADLLTSVEITGDLRRVLEIRVADLIGYQSVSYARRYLDAVRRVHTAERELCGETRLTEAVVRNLYRLMAYKDEYEVARLHLDPALRRQVQDRFGKGARVRYQLHPPAARTLGMRRKLALGRGAVPLLLVLRSLRKVRGTPFDVFGYAGMRRLERELVREYLDVLTELTVALDARNYETAVTIAELPDVVRGYESIKLASVTKYRSSLAELREGIAQPTSV